MLKAATYFPSALPLLLALLLVAVAVSGISPPPAYDFWKLGLLSVEWGGWFLLIAVLLLVFLWWQGWRSKPGRLCKVTAGLTIASAILFCLPIVDAQQLAESRSITLSPVGFFLGGFSSTRADIRRNITYALPGGQVLTLDAYLPLTHTGAQRPGHSRPAIVVVHGGGWNHGQKSDFSRLDRWLTQLDMVVFDVNYRLAAPDARFPAQLEDVMSAVAWVNQHAAEYGVDPGRICLLGRSAGAQLALLSAYKSAQLPVRTTIPPVRAVISLYAPTDLVWGYNNVCLPDFINARYLLENFLGGTPTSVPEQYALASPVRHVIGACPPTLLLHGGRDHLVSFRHMYFLRQKLVEAAVPCDAVYIEQSDHGFDANFDGWHSQIARAEMRRFLTRHVLATPQSVTDTSR